MLGMCLRLLCVGLALLCPGGLGVAAADAPLAAPKRIAIVVGANASPPGRKPLRYAQDDARAFGQVLVDLGGFAPADVRVLLDPDPERVLSELDSALSRLSGEALLVFYYSGHSDAGALYPHGRALSFGSLRERLSDARSKLRIGIIDACRGGGWTGTKGLTEAEPFEVNLPIALSAEGSVLIASSSGLEDAHESEQLGGSFFTHYWDAGLRGAADGDADGRVTLTEAFEYAKGLTIRDSALYTGNAQHPSFAMNLRGRQDLALANLAQASAVLQVAQDKGPLELVHLDSGVTVLELPQGERNLRLSVPPGRYLLQRRSGAQTWAKDIVVRAGQTTYVNERGLELRGQAEMAIKRAEPRPLTASTLPGSTQELTAGFGVSHAEPGAGVALNSEQHIQLSLQLPHGFTDRLQWVIPTLALAYRFGDRGGLEWIPWAGLVSWSVGYESWNGLMFSGDPGVGLDARSWLTPHSSVDFSAGVRSRFIWHGKQPHEDPNVIELVPRDRRKVVPPDTWRGTFDLGYTATLADSVTLHVAAGVSVNALFEGGVSTRRADAGVTLSLGSVQSIGLRPQPLVRVHLSDTVALNFDAALHYQFAQHTIAETYMVGITSLW